MQEVFDEEEAQAGKRRRDTEVTLGPALLLGLFFGLLLLCGLCFGVGYSIGSHGARGSAAVVQQPSADLTTPATSSSAKPSAAPQTISQPQGAAGTQPPAEGSAAAAGEQNSSVAPSTDAPSQPAPQYSAAPAGALMVQIAVLPRQEDAAVLVGALRRRGYAVTASRDAADGQFHVRIGPFSRRNDAIAMSQKLLRDGYNAVVQP